MRTTTTNVEFGLEKRRVKTGVVDNTGNRHWDDMPTKIVYPVPVTYLIR
jgi:hypothetical protein